MPHVQIPHFAFPLRIVEHSGKTIIETVDQGTDEEIWDCVELILHYTKGMRAEKPEFGISDPTFDHPLVDHELLKQEIREQESRINLHTEVTVDKLNHLLQTVIVEEEQQGA
jgi:hypothetical protein